jgi:hypothetical protein
MITFLPASPAAGVYVKEKGDEFAEVGLTVPSPFSVIVTLVALPPNVFPVIVIGDIPHVDPFMAVNNTAGPFIQLQFTVNVFPAAIHPSEFLIVIK